MRRLGHALRTTLRRGYGRGDLRADILAGTVVGLVALPLSMALAIASGVPPQYGLYTAIVAGFVIALLGGSSVQVSGPTAAFVVVLAPIALRFGVGGLLLAGAMAGLILVAMGIAGFGQLVHFVPSPVTTGFTAGIGVVIATLQLKDFLGLEVASGSHHFVERVVDLARALPTLNWPDFVVGAVTLIVLILWTRVDRLNRILPAPLVGLTIGAFLAALLASQGWVAETIRSSFSFVGGDGSTLGGIPRSLPAFVLPWQQVGPGGGPMVLSIGLFQSLLPAAFAIAMLGAIESLLSAVVADGMTGERHDPDSELIAQGIGNVVAPFFGGIAATGAIARTATNVRSGARSPLAAAFHALLVLAAMLLLAPTLGYLPMAALAALLLTVAWRMSEAKHFLHLVRISPRSDVMVLLTCFSLTVLFDMTISVTVGILLAALLLLRRIAQTAGASLVSSERPHAYGHLPEGLAVYAVRGPLVFGAAQKALTALRMVDRQRVRVVVLDLEGAQVLDATGLLLLEDLATDFEKTGIRVVLVGVQEQPLRAMAKAGWRRRRDRLRIFRSVPLGLEAARRLAEATEPAVPQ